MGEFHYNNKLSTNLENISMSCFVIWTNPESEENISPVCEMQIL